MNHYIVLGSFWIIGMYMFVLLEFVYCKYKGGIDAKKDKPLNFGDLMIMMCWPLVLSLWVIIVSCETINKYSIIVFTNVHQKMKTVTFIHFDTLSTKIVKRIKKC